MTNYLISTTGLSTRIQTLPGREPFMLAVDLANAYQTRTEAVVQAVKRNPDRFPEDFAFRLTEGETEALKSQNVISNMANRDLPLAFTHAGGLALSGVLKTEIAARVSVTVHRAFAAMEKRAFDQMRYTMLSLQSEAARYSALRVQVLDGVRAGMTFDGIWRMGSASKPKLAKVVRQCFAMALIDALPHGTPDAQADLFGGVSNAR